MTPFISITPILSSKQSQFVCEECDTFESLNNVVLYSRPIYTIYLDEIKRLALLSNNNFIINNISTILDNDEKNKNKNMKNQEDLASKNEYSNADMCTKRSSLFSLSLYL